MLRFSSIDALAASYMVCALALAAPAYAQEIIELEKIELGDKSTREITADEIEGCVERNECSGFGVPGASYSIDGLVELGIVKNKDIPQDIKRESAAPLPSIDIEILFDFGSASIRDDQVPKFEALRTFIGKETNVSRAFVLIGHTDAKNSAEFNLQLSKRRADAVKAYLDRSAQGRRLIAIGRGFEDLKDRANPYSGVNRRVQLVVVPDAVFAGRP